MALFCVLIEALVPVQAATTAAAEALVRDLCEVEYPVGLREPLAGANVAAGAATTIADIAEDCDGDALVVGHPHGWTVRRLFDDTFPEGLCSQR